MLAGSNVVADLIHRVGGSLEAEVAVSAHQHLS